MAAAPQTTLIELVNGVAQSVGHPKTTDVLSSQDESILRIAYYANIACTELSYMTNWQWLSRTAAITIVANYYNEPETAFDLPADYHAMVDDTHWDRNTQLPAIGPINPQDWQWLIVRKTMITTRFMWRIRDKKLWVKSAPAPDSGGHIFSFEYLSKYWAVDGDTGQLQDLMNKNNDYHLYPWQLPLLYTRAKWFENEGYDSSGAQSDFQRALQYEMGVDKGATALTLVPGAGYPYIDAIKNVPDTGYGMG